MIVALLSRETAAGEISLDGDGAIGRIGIVILVLAFVLKAGLVTA